jgi:hypothetical protein
MGVAGRRNTGFALLLLGVFAVSPARQKGSLVTLLPSPAARTGHAKNLPGLASTLDAKAIAEMYIQEF